MLLLVLFGEKTTSRSARGLPASWATTLVTDFLLPIQCCTGTGADKEFVYVQGFLYGPVLGPNGVPTLGTSQMLPESDMLLPLAESIPMLTFISSARQRGWRVCFWWTPKHAGSVVLLVSPLNHSRRGTKKTHPHRHRSGADSNPRLKRKRNPMFHSQPSRKRCEGPGEKRRAIQANA